MREMTTIFFLLFFFCGRQNLTACYQIKKIEFFSGISYSIKKGYTDKID